MAPHVIFIHGMYLNGQSWQPWVERFAAAGFSGSAPSWPYHHGDPATLRSEVSPDLGALTFGTLTGHTDRALQGTYRRSSRTPDPGRPLDRRTAGPTAGQRRLRPRGHLDQLRAPPE